MHFLDLQNEKRYIPKSVEVVVSIFNQKVKSSMDFLSQGFNFVAPNSKVTHFFESKSFINIDPIG